MIRAGIGLRGLEEGSVAKQRKEGKLNKNRNEQKKNIKNLK